MTREEVQSSQVAVQVYKSDKNKQYLPLEC